MPGHIILSHGSDSSPEATKVSALAAAAEALGWSTQRPDYRDCDRLDRVGAAGARLEQLLRCMRACAHPPLLVGSSMGAFVSGLASRQAPCAGLFLMALPTGLPGEDPVFEMDTGVPAMVVHGYQDAICPVEAALHYTRAHGVPTLLLEDGHRLASQLDALVGQFRLFLQGLTA